jgi:hypothetical protein
MDPLPLLSDTNIKVRHASVNQEAYDEIGWYRKKVEVLKTEFDKFIKWANPEENENSDKVYTKDQIKKREERRKKRELEKKKRDAKKTKEQLEYEKIK